MKVWTQDKSQITLEIWVFYLIILKLIHVNYCVESENVDNGTSKCGIKVFEQWKKVD